MKISNNVDERVHILDSHTNVWSVIRSLTKVDQQQEDAFYVCDLGEIVRKHKIWKATLPRVIPHYAVKCNDSLTVLEVLCALGTSFDCASKAEINKVLSLGVDPKNIIFANPAKLKSHIKHAAATGVETMTFDNELELEKVRELHPNARLVIRIRSDAADAQCQLGMKYGCDPINEAPHLLHRAKSLGLNVVGVSFHVGSGCRESAVFRRAISSARDLFDYAATLGFSFNLLDIGGGFPGGRLASLDEFGKVINDALNHFFPNPEVKVIAEPGRFYVSSAYTLACNIHSIRNVKGAGDLKQDHRMYYINDGVYGSFNCILYDHQVVVPKPLKEYNGDNYYSSSIWGPTCDGLDQVVEDILLPDMKAGDWIVFEDMGAYTLPVASTFNGFPVPRVHVVAHESIWTLFKDLMPFTDNHFEMASLPYNANCGCMMSASMDFSLSHMTGPQEIEQIHA